MTHVSMKMGESIMREATALEIIITVSLTYKQFGVVVRDKHVIVVLVQIFQVNVKVDSKFRKITIHFMEERIKQRNFIRMKIVMVCRTLKKE